MSCMKDPSIHILKHFFQLYLYRTRPQSQRESYCPEKFPAQLTHQQLADFIQDAPMLRRYAGLLSLSLKMQETVIWLLATSGRSLPDQRNLILWASISALP